MCKIKNLCLLLLIRLVRGLERGLGIFCRREYRRASHTTNPSQRSSPPSALRYAASASPTPKTRMGMRLLREALSRRTLIKSIR